MRKKRKDEINIGEYKIIRSSVRVQGRRYKPTKTRVNPVALLFSICVLVGLIFASLFSFGGGVCYTTYNKFITGKAASEPKRQDERRAYKSMAVIEKSTGRVLDAFNENERLPMASTTKIMTALVAIENNNDLLVEHEVPAAAVGIEGTSMYLKRGEKLSVHDLLYGLMLPSGNDAATALAIITAGSEEGFVLKMNEKAASLGLSNTKFSNPHGLHAEEHYTTSLDLAKLTASALDNETFREVFGTKQIKVKGKSESEPRILTTKQKLLKDENLKSRGITVTGGKSGFTPEAGRCLVTSAKDESGMEVVAVVLNAPTMFESSAVIIDSALDNYKMVNVLSPKNHITSIDVMGSKTEKVNIYSNSSFSYPLTSFEESTIKVDYSYPELLYAPIDKNQEIGEVVVSLDGEVLYKAPILSIEDAKNTSIYSIFKEILKEF